MVVQATTTVILDSLQMMRYQNWGVNGAIMGGLTHGIKHSSYGNVGLPDSYLDAQHHPVVVQHLPSYVLCHCLYQQGWLSFHHISDVAARVGRVSHPGTA